MKEFYTFEGQSYEVDPSRLEEFLGQFPNATKVDGLGKTTDPASESMDSGSESGSSVLLDRIETGKDKRLCNCGPDSGVKRYGFRVGKWFIGVTTGN